MLRAASLGSPWPAISCSALLFVARLSLACSAALLLSASLGSCCHVLILYAALRRSALVGMFRCSALPCIVLHCSALVALLCPALFWSSVRCAALHCSALLGFRWPALLCSVLLYSTMRRSAVVVLFCCSAPLCIAQLSLSWSGLLLCCSCNNLRYSATLCSALLHSAPMLCFAALLDTTLVLRYALRHLTDALSYTDPSLITRTPRSFSGAAFIGPASICSALPRSALCLSQRSARLCVALHWLLLSALYDLHAQHRMIALLVEPCFAPMLKSVLPRCSTPLRCSALLCTARHLTDPLSYTAPF
jgi:hypothetical protein